jgi:uncharacterized protein with PIN domain
MIVDTSAVLAILQGEPGATNFAAFRNKLSATVALP